MVINETLQTCTPIVFEKAKAFIPSHIILAASILIIIPIVFALLSTKKTNWGRFWVAMAIIVVATGIILIGSVQFPTTTNNIIEFFRNLFS